MELFLGDKKMTVKGAIEYIISKFTPLGLKHPKDEEETSQTQKQQIQKQNLGKFGVIAILIFVEIFIFILAIIFINSNKNIKYSTIETTNKSYNQTEKIETKEITLANVGDYIKFGSYPQTSSGQEQPIEWQVLAKENNKMLVITRYGLEAKRFDNSSNKWKNSEIRQWLNGDFYNKAFSEDDKKSINLSNLSDVGTSDNVFLLSREEAKKYFANNDLRMCKATDYAVKNGAWVADSDFGSYEGYSWWWLRSSFFFSSNGVYIVNYGGIVSYNFVFNTYDLVRPALWINL